MAQPFGDEPGDLALKEVVFTAASALVPSLAMALQFGSKVIEIFQFNDRAIEQMVDDFAKDEVPRVNGPAGRMAAELNDEQRATLEEETRREPLRTQKIINDHLKATALASDEKREAMRALTAARFDPRKNRGTRDLYFSIAAELKDHEIHALLKFTDRPSGAFSFDQIVGGYDGAELDAMEQLCAGHPTLIRKAVSASKQFTITDLGTRLVNAMRAYRAPRRQTPDKGA